MPRGKKFVALLGAFLDLCAVPGSVLFVVTSVHDVSLELRDFGRLELSIGISISGFLLAIRRLLFNQSISSGLVLWAIHGAISAFGFLLFLGLERSNEWNMDRALPLIAICGISQALLAGVAAKVLMSGRTTTRLSRCGAAFCVIYALVNGAWCLTWW